MTLDAFTAFCESLPHATYVRQWGDSHVWKIGGKVFAIAGDEAGEITGVSFKVTPIAFHILKDQPGCQGAPYMASRGMKWIQRTSAETLPDDELLTYLRDSYRLVAAGLTKKLQKELGLSPTVPKGFPS
ncbi:MAG: MmcQ/YjbR family DNA-binding protein [Rhodospirillales bacterium]|tara:strand:- start:1331 stop:1717 length:387 start_codon:yes stop_codon:yes gene_type:complete